MKEGIEVPILASENPKTGVYRPPTLNISRVCSLEMYYYFRNIDESNNRLLVSFDKKELRGR